MQLFANLTKENSIKFFLRFEFLKFLLFCIGCVTVSIVGVARGPEEDKSSQKRYNQPKILLPPKELKKNNTL